MHDIMYYPMYVDRTWVRDPHPHGPEKTKQNKTNRTKNNNKMLHSVELSGINTSSNRVHSKTYQPHP